MYTSIRVASRTSPMLVVGVYADGKDGGGARSGGLTAAQARTRDALRARPGFRAEPGETAGDGSMMLVGLGPRDGLTTDRLRTVGAAIVRALDRCEAPAARLVMAETIAARTVKPDAAGRAVGEGMGLANWRVDFFDGTATKTPAPRASLAVHATSAPFRAGLAAGLKEAACANEARRIAATPPNVCHPGWIASEARRLARKSGLTCRVISYAEAQRQGMGGIVNVGRGSRRKPCMVILEHKPARARKGVTLALVGKTMTYDSGGYSLKPPASMKGMKYDGNGGCAVLGAMLAIAARKLPVRVVGLLPAAENMVSSEAYRPDDIIKLYNGVTVEVTNTDAEGRLILADALAYACKRVKPTAVIDVATLTGGVVVALGSWCAGMFCNDDGLRERLETASATTGERLWRLPLWDDHRDFMRARHADLWNSGPKRDGHPIQGAAFLSYFVDEAMPWAHLDIAGVSAVDSDTDMYVTGPTGFGVRLLTEVAAGYAGK